MLLPKPLWFQGEWTDGAQDFWDDFISDGSLDVDSGKVQEVVRSLKYMISVIFIFRQHWFHLYQKGSKARRRGFFRFADLEFP